MRLCTTLNEQDKLQDWDVFDCSLLSSSISEVYIGLNQDQRWIWIAPRLYEKPWFHRNQSLNVLGKVFLVTQSTFLVFNWHIMWGLFFKLKKTHL